MEAGLHGLEYGSRDYVIISEEDMSSACVIVSVFSGGYHTVLGHSLGHPVRAH
jgi:hypothetical protein